MKKIILLFIICTAFVNATYASSYSGTCGDNLTWELDKDTIYLISEDTGQNCTFRDETELMSYINTVKENYRNSAGVIYLTDWIKNYWIIVPHQ